MRLLILLWGSGAEIVNWLAEPGYDVLVTACMNHLLLITTTNIMLLEYTQQHLSPQSCSSCWRWAHHSGQDKLLVCNFSPDLQMICGCLAKTVNSHAINVQEFNATRQGQWCKSSVRFIGYVSAPNVVILPCIIFVEVQIFNWTTWHLECADDFENSSAVRHSETWQSTF